jgi:hypothetical protein
VIATTAAVCLPSVAAAAPPHSIELYDAGQKAKVIVLGRLTRSEFVAGHRRATLQVEYVGRGAPPAGLTFAADAPPGVTGWLRAPYRYLVFLEPEEEKKGVYRK